MSNRGDGFAGAPRGGYASKPGDARRCGRVADAPPVRGLAAPIVITFKETSACIEARLGVVVVGSVTHDVTTGNYFWALFLPMMANVPRPARDADKAKDAIAHKVREWCEAAALISARRAGA